jgi:hypothetical protein
MSVLRATAQVAQLIISGDECTPNAYTTPMSTLTWGAAVESELALRLARVCDCAYIAESH